ncbi:MAG: family 16 glycoside hydrolase [Bacteroidota bacterium]
MKYFKLLTLFAIVLFFSCTNDTEESVDIDRPYSPWIFRSVLDVQPRMLTMALHDELWVAYHTETGALYKAWKGFVEFDGAVYTTAHGPQPLSVGDAYLVNQFKTPWYVIQDGKEIPAKVQFKGHRYHRGHGELNYELSWGDQQKAKVTERPEYQNSEGGLTIFERLFTTAEVPEGVQIGLRTNVSSIALKNQIQTDGNFELTQEKERKKGKVSALDISGQLLLNSNGTTRFDVQFVKQPMIENTNKLGKDVDQERPEGYRLIARADCKSCHNTYRKTIGPAYVDIAKKYRTNAENRAFLVQKIQKGGSGVWGGQVMSAHPDLPEGDIASMVDYILSLDAEEEANSPEEVTAPEATDYLYGVKNVEEADLFPGVVAKLYTYQKDLQKLADLKSGGKLVSAGVTPIVKANAESLTGMENNFAIFFTGYIKIDVKGEYTFRLASDDGSKLLINGQQIIDHDGLHGADEKDGAVALDVGYHQIDIDFFQGYGGKSIVLSWKKPDKPFFTMVPKAALFHHPKDRPASTQTPMPLAVAKRIPGDGYPVNAVHPSYDLSQARPDAFTPKVGGMDFLSDGRLVISTWDPTGAIYVLDGVQSGEESKITATKIASGFAEPLGLKVVDDEIYVLQKQELSKLVDHDGDGLMDEYQTICNGWRVSANFHEFAFGLAYQDGYFYATLATAINPGGASTQPQIPDRGKVVKISKADGSFELIAHGLRTPNGVGLGMDDQVFVSDNQGDWLPASKIVHVQEGAWYGSRSVDFAGTANLTETLPVVWLPQDEIGNSPSTPMGIKDGPYKGQLIHGEVTHGGVKRVFVEEVNGAYQGCLFRFIQGLEAGVNRMTYGPDGALYIGGIGNPGNWRHDGRLWYGLQRLKYNGESTFEMLAVRAKSNGIEIEFTEALRPGAGWDPADYHIQQWRYEPTEAYGGPKLDLKNLNIRSVSVSEDRKRVFLELEGMKANHLVYVRLKDLFISEQNHQLWSTEAWYTMNQIPSNTPGTVRPSPVNQSLANTLSEEEKAAGWKLLFDGKTTDGWTNYKKESIGSSWVVTDGVLMLKTSKKADGSTYAKDGGDIVTAGEYENFELSLEWKISSCGNSGIFYNVVDVEENCCVWQTGPEMQILDNTCHPDARFETHRAGDLYDMIECSHLTVNPAGNWNKVNIYIKDGQVEHWLNGRKVVEFTMFDDNWNQMIANSKFKDMKGFGQSRKGRIALQDHSDQVWFRNIKIREL